MKEGYISDAAPPACQSLSTLPRGCSFLSRETNLSCWPRTFPTCQDPFNHRHKGPMGHLALPGYQGVNPEVLDTPQHPLVTHCLCTSSTRTFQLSSSSSLQQRALRRQGEAAHDP